MKLVTSTKALPLASLITIKHLKSSHGISVEWVADNKLLFDDIPFDSDASLCRYIARLFPDYNLYGTSSLLYLEVDHWLSFGIGPFWNKPFSSSITYLDRELANVTYLVGQKLTIADIFVWSLLAQRQEWNDSKNKEIYPNLCRWYSFVGSHSCVVETFKIPGVTENMSQHSLASKTSDEVGSTGGRKEEGKFIELPGAEQGKVVVRFPPEASGYLHIGHAKAALLNQYYKDRFHGKLIMRFDDTNPAKEKVDFEKVILEDLELLQIQPDVFTHTSDYFDLMLKYCETLLKEGKAYVDDTEPETMKIEREKKVESKHRNNSVANNMKMWREMLLGTEYGVKCCVRAKIDMNSANGCMRDPTIYRCKPETHPKTGNKYKVYPTYDFACPIVDSIEGVTHCLRTTEYHDRDDQFYWFIDALGLRKPYIWEYSRLNMTNTVLSKRKLTWFVEEGYVDGWDDPRFPTVRGIIRRGMTVAGLKQFIIAQGSSRSVVMMEWDKIWAFNKKVIDPIAPRYNALESTDNVPVYVEGVRKEKLQVPKHPKNDEVGKKWIWKGNKVLIDRIDADALKENENATFINWGNLMIKKINRDGKKITSIEAVENISNTDYKKTLKLTWLADLKEAPFVPCICVYFDHIITKSVLAKDEDFKQFINPDTKISVKMLGDPELVNVKKGDIIQLQRRGFYICDQEFRSPSIYTSEGCPIVLFFIPDGHSKENPITAQSKRETSETKKEAKHSQNSKDEKKGKDSKKSTNNIAANKTTEKCTLDAATIENVREILDRIKGQGDRIRQLKSDKAEKSVLENEVKILLQLKSSFKELTKIEWKPGVTIDQFTTSSSTEVNSTQDVFQILDRIKNEGDYIRILKADKADKSVIEKEVKILLQLKERFKEIAKVDWKPGLTVDQFIGSKSTGKSELNENKLTCDSSVDFLKADLPTKICLQASKVRSLQKKKANKNLINTELTALADSKEKYLAETGKVWSAEGVNLDTYFDEYTKQLYDAVTAQGVKVRELQRTKAAEDLIEEERAKFFALRTVYEELAESDHPPSIVDTVPDSKKATASKSATPTMSDKGNEVLEKIAQQGNTVRQLKSDKSNSKEVINQAVKVLLDLKEEYKKITGVAWSPTPTQQTTSVPVKTVASSGTDKANKTKKPQVQQKPSTSADSSSGSKKQTRLGLEAKKEENLADWYTQIITKSELIEYYDVSGCYTLRPWAFAIWKIVRAWFDAEITNLGVDECYFPIFVSRSVLEREKTHIADFAPEVAWVTKSGDSELEEPVAIRPTSETVMYPAYAKWIRSHRDLPLKLNQWSNVVRWEFKHPQPFLRTREFLWQEGHTAYATKEEAEEEVLIILDLYAKVYTDLLAVPVVKGRKTEKEKFAGGDFTTTVEAFVSASGRGIQGATSHHLGQNFSKMFDIVFEDPETQEKKYVYQNSWGITTRSVGVMIMVHSDNRGLVLPPRVAKIQVVIVPCGITANLKAQDRKTLDESCVDLEKVLNASGVKVHYDSRDNYSSGWKFNHWELKGVPIRVELGPKDIKQGQVVAVRRDTGEKIIFKRETILKDVTELLSNIQTALYKKAEDDLKSHTKICEDWSQFVDILNDKNIILSPFCGEISCEEKVKQDSARNETDPGAPSMGAKSLCIPFEQPKQLAPNQKCIHPDCGNNAKFFTLFGRSY